ncbi:MULTISPECIES: GNAT family N-acetyltransferase [unclassified Sphingomonas]|uniref:GNAT family N-acetyltransferase n=1 Tax=unclassified Sphingomonas TaxID=196159 RepID=UPI000E75F53C|nr:MULTISPECIES: GNAT family N-acetyltransferase [unclassified Sphingomonas]RKE53057.1 putative acetyltransferase [Sphingomonas sp. PP-CC-1A-547]TCM09550.1 putative acetyltransferase [Sphingomonas sp. PP-CC-3G-468]
MKSEAWRIVRDDLTKPEVVSLVELHLRAAHENSPPGSVFALDLTGLRDPTVTVWSAWDGDRLVGLAALKQLDDAHGELKSMRTAPAYLRRGVARMMLDHVVAEARTRGYRRISLETGTAASFNAAHAMYEHAGFTASDPFGVYSDRMFAAYYTLEI